MEYKQTYPRERNAVSYDIGSKRKQVDNQPQITIASKEESSVCVSQARHRRDTLIKKPTP